MSKCDLLREHIRADGRDTFRLTYDEIEAVQWFRFTVMCSA
jgi:hypothetical protein